MLSPAQKEELINGFLSPYFHPLDDYIDLLDDIIDECEDEKDREALSVVIDYLNLAITEIQKVLKRKE